MKKALTVALLVTILFTLNIPNIEAKTTLNKCIDGDTASLNIDGKIKKVRFLAIDTPETNHPTLGEEPYGKEASNYTCNALKNAKTIEIEYDKNSDKTDKYDRQLVWIFVDGKLLQKQLIKKGYAKVAYLYGDYKYTGALQKAQKQAKKEKVGIWSNYKEDYTDLYKTIAIIALIIILCIFSKKIRKKVIKKSKTKINKKINKEIDKQLDKLLK